MDTPSRPVVREQANAATPGTTMHRHGSAVDVASKATSRVVGDKLETDSPIAETPPARTQGAYLKTAVEKACKYWDEAIHSQNMS